MCKAALAPCLPLTPPGATLCAQNSLCPVRRAPAGPLGAARKALPHSNCPVQDKIAWMKKKKEQQSPRYQNRIVSQAEVDPHTLEPSPWNWRTHPVLQKDAMAGALRELGWIQQLVVNQRTGHLVDGHLRLALALDAKEPTVPVLYVDLSEAEEKLALVSLDPLAAMAEASRDQLAALLQEVNSGEAAVQAMLAQLAEQAGLFPEPSGDPPEGEDSQAHATLAEQFLVPPFSVLDARQGYWQARKSAWIALGIQSELGRGGSL